MKWSRYNILFHSKKIGYGLFNSRMLSFSRLDKRTYEVLCLVRENVDVARKILSNEDVNNLLNKKILVNDSDDDIFLNMLKYKKQVESYTSKYLGLVICPTLSCNFACPYCYEYNLPKYVMNEQTQEEIILFINKYAPRMDGLTLNWHGGEPLLAFDTIKHMYNLLEKKSKLRIEHSSMVSNGYLLNEEICLFLSEKNLNYLQITIDGNKETHDKTRVLKNGQSSFEKILENVDMATKLMPNCKIGIRTNIGKSNQEDYIELYRALSNRWRGKNCIIYHTYVLDNSTNTTKERRESLELTTEEKNNFELLLARKKVTSKKNLYPRMDRGICTCMDNNAFVIDPQGFLYKCWADVGIKNRSIGNLSEGINNYGIMSQFMVASDKFADEKCLKCPYIPICDGSCNLYRVGMLEKGIPYDVCCINEGGLIKYLETFIEDL